MGASDDGDDRATDRAPYVSVKPPEYLETDDGRITAGWSNLDADRASVAVTIAAGSWETTAMLDVDDARGFLEELREEIALAAAFEARGGE